MRITCKDCKKTRIVTDSFVEKATGAFECPHCGGNADISLANSEVRSLAEILKDVPQHLTRGLIR